MSDYELKKAIARMYYAMSRSCKRDSEWIKENLEDFKIEDLKKGYELKVEEDGRKYQLILEFREVKEE